MKKKNKERMEKERKRSLISKENGSNEEDEEEVTGKKFGAIFTVALAFFLGELGDKTQLTALTLSTQSTFPALTLAGTVLGMVVVSSFGIFIGSKLGDKIPEHVIRISAFVIFMLVKQMNRLKKAEPAPPPAPTTEDVLLLREIRDALKK